MLFLLFFFFNALKGLLYKCFGLGEVWLGHFLEVYSDKVRVLFDVFDIDSGVGIEFEHAFDEILGRWVHKFNQFFFARPVYLPGLYVLEQHKLVHARKCHSAHQHFVEY